MKKTLCFALVLSGLLCACGLTKKYLGLNRSTPDETKVEPRTPLDLPPDFDTLPE